MSEVSIIVPAYNAALFIEKCIDTILEQSFHDYELIIVNDGSIDETEALCIEYAKRDLRIKLYTQKNQGPDVARKNGVLNANGKFLLFVDADDSIAPNMLQELLIEQRREDADLVCSQILRMNEQGKVWNDCSMKVENIICENVKDSFYHFFVTRMISTSYSAKLIKKEILKGYEFSKSAVVGEDVTAVIYMLEQAKRVKIIDRGYYYYYWNLGSISHSGYTKRHVKALDNYIKRKEELIRKAYIEEHVIHGFFAEYEMAVVTAMCRNQKYEKEVIAKLKRDLEKSKNSIFRNKSTSLFMKSSILIFLVWPWLFLKIYRGYHFITRR